MATNTEDLKLIASYMGAHWDVEVDGRLGVYNNTISAIDYYLDYDKDWNLLMGVVEKIEQTSIYEPSTDYDNREKYKGYSPRLFTLFASGEIKGLNHDEMRFKTKIEAMYKAVVDYILWLQKDKSE